MEPCYVSTPPANVHVPDATLSRLWRLGLPLPELIEDLDAVNGALDRLQEGAIVNESLRQLFRNAPLAGHGASVAFIVQAWGRHFFCGATPPSLLESATVHDLGLLFLPESQADSSDMVVLQRLYGITGRQITEELERLFPGIGANLTDHERWDLDDPVPPPAAFAIGLSCEIDRVLRQNPARGDAETAAEILRHLALRLDHSLHRAARESLQRAFPRLFSGAKERRN